MALLRSDRTLDALKQAYRNGDATKDLRSYHMAKYQQEMIDILAKDSGLSKAGVVREIFDEWYSMKVSELESGQ